MKSIQAINPLTKIRIMIIGILLVSIDIPLKLFSIAYGYSHYRLEGIYKFAYIEVANAITGDEYAFDLAFDVIGYLLIMIAVYALFSYCRSYKIAMYALVVAALTYGAIKIVPVFLGDKALCIALFVLLFIKIFAYPVALYNIIIMFVKQSNIDRYMYMEVEKDLKFSWEINFAAGIVIPILQLMSLLQVFFASLGETIVYWVNVIAMLYFCLSIYKYTYKLKLFNNTK